MSRLLTVFIFLFMLSAAKAQSSLPRPVFHNGELPASSSLLNRKLHHPLWLSAKLGNDYYVIVQMKEIPTGAARERIARHGIRLSQYINSNSYFAVCDPDFNPQNFSALGIENIFALPATSKASSKLLNRGSGDTRDLLAVTTYPALGFGIQKALTAAGASIADTRIKPPNTWFIRATDAAVRKILQLPFITSVAPIHLEDVPLNYNNRAAHAVQPLSATTGRNLTGRGVVIGIGDNANPSDHIDLKGKLILRTDEPIDDHGTFTSGILAGGGILNPWYKGMAPGARLVVNDFSNILVNSPVYVHDYNMPLTNNSYYNGLADCPGEGEYNVLSSYVDSQMLAYPKLLHVFASGNDGYSTCAPFPSSYATIKSGFQTGKNILTVGSIDNFYYTWGGASSKGPVEDGRIKPEVMAGGVGIYSTLPGNGYTASSGTSLACPAATGILALIAERYRQLHTGENPDGALLKAVISNSAEDLGNPGPDFSFGFGMINARKAVECMEQNHYFKGVLSNGESLQFTIPAPTGTDQLKVMLYWPDAPAIPLATTTLVNDLDLTVTEPGGAVRHPLVLDPAPVNVNVNAVEGTDHLNNIEQAVLHNATAGNYLINVQGSSVPAGPQEFYVVYEILPAAVRVEYPFGSETWVPGETENIRWTAQGADANGFTVEYTTDGGSSWNLISNSVPATARLYSWPVPDIASTQAKIRVTRNGTAYTDESDFNFTILHTPALTATNTCPGYVRLTWNSVPGADAYDITRFVSDSMQVTGRTTDTSWLVPSLNKDSSYWFSVNASRSGIAGRRAIAQQVVPNTGPCTESGLKNDLVLESVVSPVSGRLYTSSAIGVQPITLQIRNAGTTAIAAPVAMSFQVNGGAVITETNTITVSALGKTTYTFSLPNSYDFSAPGVYQINAWVKFSADSIHTNDSMQVFVKNLRNDPLILTPSYTESFESATDRMYTHPVVGLDSLARTDFSASSTYGRLNTYFNDGFARSGNRSLVLDVSTQGINAADTAVSTFNLSGYSPSDQLWLNLYFKKQSDPPALPGNQIWVRGNDQAKWIAVKNLHDASDPAGSYIKFTLDIKGTLAAASPAQSISSSFQVKCGAEGMTPAASSNPGALAGGGILFDDFTITDARHDVGVAGVPQPSPKNLCGLTSTEIVSVNVRNYSDDTLINIPISYAVNGDTVHEILSRLEPLQSLQYNFNHTADLSAFQLNTLQAWISSPIDDYRQNDSSAVVRFQTVPLINTYPYLEGFEANNGYWFSGGVNNSWAWGRPAKAVIRHAANGSKAWVTCLSGNYNDNEYSYLYSPCFDLTGLMNPVLSFSHIFYTEDACSCDFHWVEYSLDDSTWVRLGNTVSGVNWYDNMGIEAWQKTDSAWHVSSYDLPVSSKLRFRFVMYSDPGTNYEGVGIDDVHIFEKAPVFTDSLTYRQSIPVNGSAWIDFDVNGKRVLSLNPQGQDLGMTGVALYRSDSTIRDTTRQYYGRRNWVIQPTKQPAAPVRVRYYFTDSEAQNFVHAPGCDSCAAPEDPYQIGITQYSSLNTSEEDGSLANNFTGSYQFHGPQDSVEIIPYDNGYYAETAVTGFSEFWLNGGGHFKNRPLAAWLNSFTVSQIDTSGLLTWSTWAAYGTEKFIIEKSLDGLIFNIIDEVTSISHDSVSAYTFTDRLLATGTNSYRIVRYDGVGDSLLSPVRSLEYNRQVREDFVYPNPTFGTITVVTSAACREIQLFDVLGRKLLDRPAQGTSQQVSLHGFSQGIYFLKLFTDSGNKLIKLEKR